jgi:hypothetical protein
LHFGTFKGNESSLEAQGNASKRACGITAAPNTQAAIPLAGADLVAC